MGETHLLQFQDRKIRLLEDETQALQSSDQDEMETSSPLSNS